MADYRVYFQNADLSRDLEAFLFGGARHFFYGQSVSREVFVNNYHWIQAYFGVADCEIAHDRGDHVWRIRPGKQNAAPIWRFDTQDVEELRAILAEKPETVFIEWFPGRIHWASRGNTTWGWHPGGLDIVKIRKLKVKQVLEFRQDVPETEFVAVGPFNFRFFFQSGLSGGAITVRLPSASNIFAIAPDTMRVQDSPLRRALHIAGRYRAAQIDAYLKRHPLPGRGGRKVSIKVLRSVMMVQAIPDYQEKLREIELSQPYDAVKLLPEEFFPEDLGIEAPLVREEVPLLAKALPGDRVLCSTCTLKYSCPVFQPGSVCIMPASDGKALADYFNTRDAEDILTGIQAVLRKQAQRVEGAVEAEDAAVKAARKKGETPQFSDQVTKMLDGLQRNSEKFLKLVDPRFTKPVVQINQSTLPEGKMVPRDIDPASAREQLIELGMPPDAITADHIERYLAGEWNGPRELESARGTVVDEIGF